MRFTITRENKLGKSVNPYKGLILEVIPLKKFLDMVSCRPGKMSAGAFC